MPPEPEPRPPGESRPRPAGPDESVGPPPLGRLGEHCVGRRVVVRRLLRGETGPSGGPAMTDVLGEMLAWGPTSTVVRPDARPGRDPGEPVEIPLADIVSGKPVPPRARRR